MVLFQVFLLCIFVCSIHSEKLWTLEGNRRQLEHAQLRNSLFADFDGQKAVLHISTEKVRKLKENSLLEFEILSGLERSCYLQKGIPGIPETKSRVSRFNCNPTPETELHLIRNDVRGTLMGTYYDADGRSYYLELILKDCDETYILYDSLDLLNHPNPPVHNHEMDFEDSIHEAVTEFVQEKRKLQTISSTDILEYRLALLTSREFSALQGNTLEEVSAFIQNAISRVNGIYLRQLNVHFVLVSNFENGICLDGDSRATCSEVINGNFARELTMPQLEKLGIAPDSYDIGHLIFSITQGGKARVKSVCDEKNKAFGASPSFAISAEVSSFVVLFFAHELAHQLGALHTFRDCINNNDNGNRFEKTAVEPGSGTTLMSFAGSICGGATNLINNREQYFHSLSRKNIRDALEQRFLGKLNCGTRIETNIVVSEITVPTKCTIPIDTPFSLLGASDGFSKQDEFFSWDRIDTGIEEYSDETLGRFRAYEPVLNRNDRFFPNLNYLNFEQDRDFEILPTIERSMSFRFSVRTNFKLNDLITSFAPSFAGSFVSTDMDVDFKSLTPIKFDGLPDTPIQLNQGFVLSWSAGDLASISSDGLAQIFFAENTMSSISNFRLFDYRTEVDDLDWVFLKEVQISSGSTCISILDTDVDTSRLETLVGNIIIKVNTNNNPDASVRNNAGCFVFDLLTDLKFSEEASSGFQLCNAGTRVAEPALIELVPVPAETPTPSPTNPPVAPPTNPPVAPTTNPPVASPTSPVNNPTEPPVTNPTASPDSDDPVTLPRSDDTGGDGTATAVGILVSLVAVSALIGVVIYRRRQNETSPVDFDDEAPSPTPLTFVERHSLRKTPKKRKFGSLTFIGTENGGGTRSDSNVLTAAKGFFSGLRNKLKASNDEEQEGAPHAISKELSRRLERDPFPGFESPKPRKDSKKYSHQISRELSRTLEKDPFPDTDFSPRKESFAQKSKRNISAGISTLNRKRKEKTKQLIGAVRRISKNDQDDEECNEVLSTEGPKIVKACTTLQQKPAFVEKEDASQNPFKSSSFEGFRQHQLVPPKPPVYSGKKVAPKMPPIEYEKPSPGSFNTSVKGDSFEKPQHKLFAPKPPAYSGKKVVPQKREPKPPSFAYRAAPKPSFEVRDEFPKQKPETKNDKPVTGVAALRLMFEKKSTENESS